jgi:hypothetical protein
LAGDIGSFHGELEYYVSLCAILGFSIIALAKIVNLVILEEINTTEIAYAYQFCRIAFILVCVFAFKGTVSAYETVRSR